MSFIKLTEMCGIAGLLMDVLVVDMCWYIVTLLEDKSPRGDLIIVIPCRD